MTITFDTIHLKLRVDVPVNMVMKRPLDKSELILVCWNISSFSILSIAIYMYM